MKLIQDKTLIYGEEMFQFESECNSLYLINKMDNYKLIKEIAGIMTHKYIILYPCLYLFNLLYNNNLDDVFIIPIIRKNIIKEPAYVEIILKSNEDVKKKHNLCMTEYLKKGKLHWDVIPLILNYYSPQIKFKLFGCDILYPNFDTQHISISPHTETFNVYLNYTPSKIAFMFCSDSDEIIDVFKSLKLRNLEWDRDYDKVYRITNNIKRNNNIYEMPIKFQSDFLEYYLNNKITFNIKSHSDTINCYVLIFD